MGRTPTTSKASSCPLLLTRSFLVKASLHVPLQSWSGKLKIKALPPPKKEKGNQPERREVGGLKGEGLGPRILLWVLGRAAAFLEKNGDGGIQGWVALSPS